MIKLTCTLAVYVPLAMFPTTMAIPVLIVNVEPIQRSVPLHAAEKQRLPEEMWAETEVILLAVFKNMRAEVVVLRFAMNSEMCPDSDIVID
ncbi:hypothetical protein V6N13_118079 [Hibiscus sabdariffa]